MSQSQVLSKKKTTSYVKGRNWQEWENRQQRGDEKTNYSQEEAGMDEGFWPPWRRGWWHHQCWKSVIYMVHCSQENEDILHWLLTGTATTNWFSDFPVHFELLWNMFHANSTPGGESFDLHGTQMLYQFLEKKAWSLWSIVIEISAISMQFTNSWYRVKQNWP